MLHPFISAPAPRGNVAPVMMLSAALHVGLIGAAIRPARVEHLARLPAAVAEQVLFTTLPLRAAVARATRRTSGRVARVAKGVPTPELVLPPLLLSFDVMLPEPVAMPDYMPDEPNDAALEFAGNSGLTTDVLHLGLGSSRKPGAPYNSYDEGAVERRVVPASENRVPRYPSQLASRGIETNFNVYFVVDTTGTVDEKSIELPRTIEGEFIRAVEEVLPSWRFVPAVLGGRHVRQRVVQPFTFRVEGQFGTRRRP
jgi:TonB family protein